MSYRLDLPSSFIKANIETLSTGVSTICIIGGSAVRTEFASPDFVIIPQGADIHFVENFGDRNRRRLQRLGTKKVLVVRVSTPSESYSSSSAVLANTTFGIGGATTSFTSQFSACSIGKLTFAPGSGYPGITNGVLELVLSQSVAGLVIGNLENSMTIAVQNLLGVSSLRAVFDHVLFCMPTGTYNSNGGSLSWLAYAYVPGWASYYNNGKCRVLAFHNPVHFNEIPHCLPLCCLQKVGAIA
jgi:hypothetical protein